MIAIIDYGMGNLASVFNAFKKVGCNDVVITDDVEKVKQADKIVLPGVGAFEDAMKNLCQSGLDAAIRSDVSDGKPFLGICLGFQLIFERSYENGDFEGLGLLKGNVVQFDIDLPVPHIGWNQAEFICENSLFDGLDKNVYFYFDHSYYPVVENNDVIIAHTNYGVEFTSIVAKDNIYATQFHPEKSHNSGLKIIENFSNIK